MATIEGNPVEVFSSALQSIYPESVKPLPYLVDEINHKGVYVRLNDLEPGLYIDTCFLVPGDRTASDVGRKWSFTERPGLKVSREDSRHSIFFGTLQHEKSQVQVAVKSALHNLGETALFQYVADSALTTYMPVAYLQQEDGVGHTLTLFDDGPQTLDSLDWPAMTEDEIWFQVGHGAVTMAALHLRMLFHGDMMFRNIAVDDMSDIWIVDPELMVSRALQANVIERASGSPEALQLLQEITLNVSRDFGDVSKSIDETIFSLPLYRRMRSPEARFRLLKRHLYDRYRAEIISSDSVHQRLLLTVYDNLLAKKKAISRSA